MKKKFLVTAFAFLVVFGLSVLGQRDASKKPETATKPPEIKTLSPEIGTQIKELRSQFEDATKEKVFYQAQAEKADLKLAEIRAKRDVLFNRFCAKTGLDPDEWEWLDDLSGVRKKAAQTPSNRGSKESQLQPKKPE